MYSLLPINASCYYFYLLFTLLRTWAINRHGQRLTGGQVGAGNVPELCSAGQQSASGSAHVGGPLVLAQCEECGPSVFAAHAMVPGMLP